MSTTSFARAAVTLVLLWRGGAALDLRTSLLDAQRLLEQKNWVAAEQAARQVLAADPREWRALAIVGSACAEQRRFDEAVAAFQLLLTVRPGDLNANYNLGVIAMLQNRPAAALPRFQLVLKHAPQDVAALTGVLEAQLALKQSGPARVTAGKIAGQLKPENPMYYATAGLLARNGLFDLALPMLERVRSLAPQRFEVAYNLAVAYEALGRLDEAAAELQAFSGNAEASDLLGAIERRQDRPAGALKAFERAVALDESNEEFRVDLGAALLDSGRVDDAVKVFREGIRASPDSWRMRLGLGTALYIAGRYEDSAAALLETAQRQPDSSLVYALLAKAYESAPPLAPQILSSIETYLRANPGHAEVWRSYGDILYSRQNLRGARTAYERALLLDPKQAEAHLQLGLVLQAQGDPREALREFQRAVQLNSKLSVGHYQLGLAYQKLGRVREAQAEMKAFQELKVSGQHQMVHALLSR